MAASCDDISSLPVSNATSALSPVLSPALKLRMFDNSSASLLRRSDRLDSRDLCKRIKASRLAMSHFLRCKLSRPGFQDSLHGHPGLTEEGLGRTGHTR